MTNQRAEIIRMINDGHRDAVIAKAVGVTPGIVAHTKRNARARGELPKFQPKCKSRIPPAFLGKLFQAVRALNDDERKWLFRNVPKGSTVAELCVALIRDAAAGE